MQKKKPALSEQISSVLSSHTLDPEVALVARALLDLTENDPEVFFGRVLRTAIDEMLDGARTGRFDYNDLTPEEKKYVGTKAELIIRDELLLPKGKNLDLLVNGIEVDVKTSQGSAWMIPLEYSDSARYPQPPVCLFLGTTAANSSTINIGIARATLVTAGRNRDGKGTLTAAQLDTEVGNRAVWLVRRGNMAPNFLSTITPGAITRIMAQKKGQARVNQLLHETVGTVIPRAAVETMATQKDPMRRLRKDRLRKTGAPYEVLSGQWKADRAAVTALFGVNLGRDEVIAVSAVDMARLPPSLKAALLH